MSRRDRRCQERRWAKHWRRLAAAGVASLALLLAAPAADALPSAPSSSQLPGDTDCKEAPDPEFPGAGVVGDLDPPIASQGKPGGVYNEQGYGGLIWHTYDLGCGPDAAVAPDAVTDNWLGGLLFDLSKVIIAASISVNDALMDGGVLSKLDDLLVSGTAALYEGVFAPLIGVALLILGGLMLMRIFRGQLAAVSKQALFMIAALGVASATYLTPLLYTQMIDNALVGAMNLARSGILMQVGVDPKYGLGEVLHTEVVWEGWLAGEFGSANSNPAKVLGRDLARSQSFTREEVGRGEITQEQVNQKKAQYESVASRLSPQSYPYFTGKASSRVGSGAFALTEAVIYGGFQLVANVVAFICLLTIRLLILLAPLLGLVAVVRNQTLTEMFRAGAAAVWQALFLVIMATVHLAAMVAISSLALPGIGELLLMTALTIPLWWIAGPWRRLRSMVSAAGVIVNADIPAPGPRKVPSIDELWARLRHRDGEEGSTSLARRAEGLPGSAPSVPTPSDVRPGVREGAGSAVVRPAGHTAPVSATPQPATGPGAADAEEAPAVPDLARYRARRQPTQVYVPGRVGGRTEEN